jgi:hypothetical protein
MRVHEEVRAKLIIPLLTLKVNIISNLLYMSCSICVDKTGISSFVPLRRKIDFLVFLLYNLYRLYKIYNKEEFRMKTEITTNVTLPAEEDRLLKIKAAEAGLSKRSLATQITRKWLQEQSIKSRISDIITQVSRMPDNEAYFRAVEALVSTSTKLVECRVKKGMVEDFGGEYTMASEESAARQKILDALDVLRKITDIPELDPDVLSALLVEDYFTNRSGR